MRNPRQASLVFCYGTLMFPELMAAVCGRRLAPRRGAVLAGYARYRLREEAFPGIAAAPGAEVRGVLYCGVGARTLQRLDRYEDDYYDRRLLRVRAAAGPLKAWIFVVRERHLDRLTDAPWDAEEFRRRRLGRLLRRLGA